MHSASGRDFVYSPTSFMHLVDSIRPHSRSTSTIDGYITHGPGGHSLISFSSLPSSPPPTLPPPPTMDNTTTPVATAEERVQALLSNQYLRYMHRNRSAWYEDSQPLDTAPRCFQPSRRNEVPLISDWRTYARVVAIQAKWKAKHFHDAHYEVNGVVWGWSDPSTDVIVKLVTSPSVEAVEFIISNDPFHTPHIFVSHSEGEEPHCLDHLGNPDTLGESVTPSAPFPELCGYTPRQSFVGPAGKAQLLLPPRAFSISDRDAAVIEYTMMMTHRRNTMRRKAGEFHARLRHGRAHVGYPAQSHDDFVPIDEVEVEYEGFSERTECPLARLGIFQEDLTAMAEPAPNSPDDEDEEEENSFEEQVEEVSSDTRAILQRLGMLDSDSDSDSESDEERDLSGTTSEDVSDSDSSAEVSFASSTTLTTSPARVHTLPCRFGFLNLALLASDADEESSVSSFFAGGDESDCESPDTEDGDC
ncbi:hypothetical protein RhiJN_17937 [Ceratobasidium sp. AG-Ba]|nr:hypothetical protein RhiJN_17937 [Ceratobasidium sp. AG-Ba]